MKPLPFIEDEKLYIHVKSWEEACSVFEYYEQFGFSHSSLDRLNIKRFPYIKISEYRDKDLVGWMSSEGDDGMSFSEWSDIIRLVDDCECVGIDSIL